MLRRGRAVAGAEADTPRSQRARDLLSYLAQDSVPAFARLQGSDFSGAFDQVDLVVQPELVQDKAVDIRHKEPVRLLFWPDDEYPPSVFSRRDNFPIDNVHTNFAATGDGLSLCIWEENWADLKRGLTAQALVERIRDWFARTARGELHQEGQSLEPLIPSTANTLILPSGVPPEKCYVQKAIESAGRYTLLLGASETRDTGFVEFSLFQETVEPQVHGALHARPTTLGELRDLLEPMGTDISKKLGDWIVGRMAGNDAMAVLLITIPKKSSAEAEVEAFEVIAFSPNVRLHELSVLIGRAERTPEGALGVLLGGAEPDLSAIKLHGWRVVNRIDRSLARLYSGNAAERDFKLVGIGAGAIGSHVMANTPRAGLGTWTVVDDDVLLPHNLVRQVQTNDMIGWPKAETQRALLDAILDEDGCKAIIANILDSGNERAAIDEALAEADLTVDFSASPAALGYLADAEPAARVASLFFNPDGCDLVLLAEDGNRSVRIDEIEAQYFLAAGTCRPLMRHLGSARLDMLRYANACQDLTRPLPPWQVQTLSGIAAGQLATILSDADRSRLHLWRLNPENGLVLPFSVTVSQVSRHALADFRVSVSQNAVAAMRTLRERAAPNETGGVLLGSFDLSRSVLHVLSALPAPPDSRQSPTYFERGAKDLKPHVDAIHLRSAGTIQYVGEWHSHPKGVSARPSGDDEGVFAYLQAHIEPTGSPYAMFICGEVDTWFRVGWSGCISGEGTIDHAAG